MMFTHCVCLYNYSELEQKKNRISAINCKPEKISKDDETLHHHDLCIYKVINKRSKLKSQYFVLPYALNDQKEKYFLNCSFDTRAKSIFLVGYNTNICT